MTETAGTETTEAVAAETTEAAAAPAATRTESIVLERPIQTVGRRKEAVVRVRLVPGAANSTSTAAGRPGRQARCAWRSPAH